jgi:hypothetical protein
VTRSLPRFDVSIEHIVRKLGAKQASPDKSSGQRRSVGPREVRHERVEDDHSGGRRAKA